MEIRLRNISINEKKKTKKILNEIFVITQTRKNSGCRDGENTINRVGNDVRSRVLEYTRHPSTNYYARS